jgi:predicted RNA-binding protein with PIN domain
MSLPDAVQRQLLRWAAQTLGDLPAERVPAALRSVARFRPSRRATLGATLLAATMDGDPGFRAAVAEHVRTTGVDPAGEGELVERAAAAHLWAHPDAESLLAQAASGGEVGALRAEVLRLERELAAAKAAQPDTPRPAVPPAAADTGGTEALDRLRQRLRDQGTQLRDAKLAAAEAEEKATAELKVLRVSHDRALAELKNLRDRLGQEQARADRATEQVAYLRATERSTRDAAHRRIELLLDTVEQASQGLRREWQVTGGGPDPADRVAGSMAEPATGWSGDSSSLTALLALPQSHLIVDGYNVTKTGYPQLTLAEQRDRLVRELASLAARTGAEVTVVFDGAAVQVPQARFRGVRVLYSPAGITADEVIRRLVAAEPTGRVLLVVTADREIITAVVRSGARTVPPVVLLSTSQHDPR